MSADRITLRAITQEDARQLFTWRNDPFIANLGSQQRTVSWEEHLQWVQETLNAGNRWAFIILLDGVPAGQVRFDGNSSDSSTCTISIYLIEKFVSKGLGVLSISKSCEHIFNEQAGLSRIVAHVRQDNERGIRGFIRSGFVPDENDRLPGHRSFVLPRFRADLVPHNRLSFDSREAEAVASTVQSGFWAGGREVLLLESKVSELCGKKYAVAVGSGLAALRLSLLAIGIGKNEDVLLPAYSCVALPNSVLAVGANPIPMDIEGTDLNISPAQVKTAIATGTKAIIAVDTFGVPAAIETLKTYGIPVLEDCSHGFGAGVLGMRGDVTVISFYATKFLGGGEGGVLVTDDAALFERARDTRDYTDKSPSAFRLNDKMSDIHASLINVQLGKLPGFIARRRAIAQVYQERLHAIARKFPFFELPNNDPGRVWYRFTIALKEGHLNEFIHSMKEHRISVASPVENWLHSTGKYPVADMAFSSVVSLPLYPTLTDDEQDLVIHAVEKSIIKIYDGKRL